LFLHPYLFRVGLILNPLLQSVHPQKLELLEDPPPYPPPSES
jgi:hypothetical protein